MEFWSYNSKLLYEKKDIAQRLLVEILLLDFSVKKYLEFEIRFKITKILK